MTGQREADAGGEGEAAWDVALEAATEWVVACGRPGDNGPPDPPRPPADWLASVVAAARADAEGSPDV